MSKLRLLFIGDVVGKPGQLLVRKWLPHLRRENNIDGVILNGENSANNGRGISPKVADDFFELGVDVITTGNHIWDQREIVGYIATKPKLLRPLNYPNFTPGKGYVFADIKGTKIAVINALGRVFFRENMECPFRAIDSILPVIKSQTNLIFLDFHAEASSEKHALSFYLDGKITGMVGTHTHVQTADERVLPGGTAFISDLGCGGSINSCLGMKKEIIIQKFLNQMPAKFDVCTEPPFMLNGVIIEADTETGKAVSIKRFQIIDEEALDI